MFARIIKKQKSKKKTQVTRIKSNAIDSKRKCGKKKTVTVYYDKQYSHSLGSSRHVATVQDEQYCKERNTNPLVQG